MSAQPGTVVSEESELAGLLALALAGRGLRGGPSTDPVVLARRLVETDRVRVDVPGRLTVDQVADLALRAGRAETEVGRLETLRAALDAALAEVTSEVDRLRAEASSWRVSAGLSWDLFRAAEAALDVSERELRAVLQDWAPAGVGS